MYGVCICEVVCCLCVLLMCVCVCVYVYCLCVFVVYGVTLLSVAMLATSWNVVEFLFEVSMYMFRELPK